jgi:GMP synthase (glutamine-hydrolysing)
MHKGRAAVFDAPAIHGDEIVRLPENALVTASNHMSEVQAAEIRCGRGVFWGVQYHPEYDFHDIATTLLRYGSKLVEEGFFRNAEELQHCAAELEILQSDPQRGDIAWRYGLGLDLLEARSRAREISNWVDWRVRAQSVDHR